MLTLPRIEEQILDHNGWDPVDEMAIQFYDCTFKRDFGPWKRGEKASCIVLDMHKSQVSELDSQGQTTRYCDVRLEVAALWCADNNCEDPDCHRCHPQGDCNLHEKCHTQP